MLGRDRGERTIGPAPRAGRAFARSLRNPTCGWMLLAMVAADMRHVRADSKKEISSLAMGSGSSSGAK